MRLHRFYVAQPLGEEVVIDDVSLINQWTKVFRYTVGNFVILFNGDGNDYSYAISNVSKNSCLLLKQSSTSSYIPSKKTYLYFPIIKKDLFELVLQKVTELGITDLVPLITERTGAKTLDLRRLHLITKEASEQSGRGDLVKIHDPIQFKDISKSLVHNSIIPERTYVATLFGDPVISLLQNKREDTPLAFVIGPEGGWTDAEEQFIQTESFVRVSFGQATLRAETAGIVSSFLSSVL